MSAYFSLPMYSASIDQRLRLIAGKCTNCGTLAYPQRQVCISCGNQKFDEAPLSGNGKIYTFTVIARGGAPAEFDEQQTMTGVIPVGIIELDEGPKVVGQLTGISVDKIAIGMPVKAVVRKLYDQEGIIRYGTKFAPRESVNA
jgi:uncharacterized OB-fold protein